MQPSRKVLQSGLSRHLHPINETRRTVLNQPSKEQLAQPFYNLLPKDPIKLLRWKIYVRERCLVDREFRDDIESACAQDFCFWAATFGWVFEPRPPRGIPLTLWCDQADCMVWMNECFETERDLGIEKTRGLFMSWTVALFIYWLWKYRADVKIAYTTKDETTLDGPDANSFMGKVAYIHEKMPAWARIHKDGKDIMQRTRDQHLIVNRANGATFQGFVPTDQKLRSLRFTLVVYDEFAFFPRNAQDALNAAVHTSPCRFFISTWFGHDSMFHTIMRVEKSTMLRVEAYWWNNYERWRGAYIYEHGKLKIIDKDYKYPPDYPFVQDGLLRSPWVDFELRRAGSKVQSALEELYGLQAEAGRKLVKGSTIDIVRASVLPPFAVGYLDAAAREPTFRKSPDGLLKLWAELGGGKRGPFAAGCDLAFGRGANYSTLEVIDLAGGEQVLEYADNSIDIVDFAGLVVDILRWLNGHHGDGYTLLDFEANGDLAVSFGAELLRLGYGNIVESRYKRKVADHDRTKYLGTRNRDGGLSAIVEMERAIRDGELTIRSEAVMEELEHFDKDEKGRPVFHATADGHGDRTQGLAIAWQGARNRLIDPEPVGRETAHDELKNLVIEHRRWDAGWRMRAA